ncbi:carbamoyltransferase C-terminal domain-containing protein [Streptacidiphilus sp. P02-A3a]|uniref:carbamoyltransferase C-terminal domain-containing protein n=1 Tax=Streptacidiphilus sp. P02-A3a TaxID=2704468 RepID=UPI0015FB61D4|nr:carbamoyltransferase C-terminal domain-containing protein [Streptacidiphilus sp. P02-A3a]QMU71309.1 carbamoyltransferase [Streptacidiphilus sp. P02-A3a]
MIILGLHYGHDAAAAVVRDGEVAAYVLRERHTRVKHAATLDLATVRRALAVAGITAAELDAVAVCSTQGVELIVDDPAALAVEYTAEDPFGRPCTVLEEEGAEAALRRGGGGFLDLLYDPALSATWLGRSYAKLFPEHAGTARADLRATPWVDDFASTADWAEGRGLAALAAAPADVQDRLRYGFHLPVRVTLDGSTVPGYALHHHLAHAASGYYQSGFDQAAVLTHDGYAEGEGCHSGMFYLGRGQALYPLTPHHLGLGGLYDRVGAALGLGLVGPAGKLMGLSAYGRPRFYSSRFLGNHTDLSGRLATDATSAWLRHCRREAERMGYDLAPYGDPARATAPINADIAASTQKLFEEVRIEAVRALHASLGAAGLTQDRLCLSGGTALNCPSNSQIAQEGPFPRVFVEPACDDSGIAIGAALAVLHSVLDRPLPPSAGPAGTLPSPYLGAAPTPEAVDRAVAAAGDRISAERLGPRRAAERAAEDLAADAVVAWFAGGSEAGPRALGHRSIMADPRRAENWPRVNRIKDREAWRPFAPAVLAEHAAEWFREVPLPSPYMLFNAKVRRGDIPAVTHVDGTARIQTVDESAGGYHAVISAFHRLTGVPVVMNTSLNGPGEPIVEQPEQALELFLKTGLDVLYLDGIRITRA